MEKLPLYIVDIKEPTDRMLYLSLVAKPATGMQWKVIEQDEQNTRLFAPIIPANTPIYRSDDEMGKYNLIFLPDVIKDLMLDAAKRHIPFDTAHSGIPIKGVTAVESFQIDYSNRKLYSGYTGLSDGSWCMILNIENIVFNDSEEKRWLVDFSGISVSAIFSYHKVELQEAIELYNNLNIK